MVQYPKRQTSSSAGMDFYAPEDIEIEPGKWTIIDTGIKFTGDEVVISERKPIDDWFMMIVPRSGLGIRHGMRFRNTVCIIDKDYRGEIILCATADEYIEIKEGERYCQGIILPFCRLSGEECVNAVRGEGGMGSTGE